MRAERTGGFWRTYPVTKHEGRFNKRVMGEIREGSRDPGWDATALGRENRWGIGSASSVSQGKCREDRYSIFRVWAGDRGPPGKAEEGGLVQVRNRLYRNNIEAMTTLQAAGGTIHERILRERTAKARS